MSIIGVKNAILEYDAYIWQYYIHTLDLQFLNTECPSIDISSATKKTTQNMDFQIHLLIQNASNIYRDFYI